MTQLLFRLFNAPALLLLTLFGVAIQTSVFSFWLLHYLQPDCVLLVAIWCALRREFVEGGIICLILGNIAENHSAAPQGLFLIVYITVFLAIRGASRLILIPNLTTRILVALAASIFVKIYMMMILMLLGAEVPPWKTTLLYLFPSALVNGICARWIFEWLEKFDRMTFKTVQAETPLMDDVAFDLEEG